MTEQIRGAGQPSWPLSSYQIQVSYGASGAIARGTGADWFGPLDPLKPIAPPDVAGRRFDFPPGYNLVTRPRAYEPVGFAELRGFADAYDLLRLVIETRKDQMERQRWRIRPRTPSLSRPRLGGSVKWARKSAAIDAEMSTRIAALQNFFEKPDGVTRWKTWLRSLLEDMFVIDAATLYCQRTRNGQLCALQQLDGSTIKRVIDDWGRTPQPYAAADDAIICPPAYQQVLKGLPAVNYSARDIIYRPRNVRAHRVYGYSPVQQVLMTVNIALRRQLWQLDYFTEGSIPDALIGVPQGWTPDQIKQFQDYWDTEFAGDLAKRRRAKFVPGDTAAKVVQTKEPSHKDDFDEWLARIICYAFSVPPQWATKVMNRATADNQSEQAEDEGLEPTKEWVKDLADEIIAEEFASPDLELAWLDEDERDPKGLEAVLEGRVKLGAVTLNEMRDSLGLDPYANPAADRAMVLTPTGYVPIEANAGGKGTNPTADPNTQAANGHGASLIEKYSADQPRAPAGNSDGGQWTSEGASGSSSSPGSSDSVDLASPDSSQAGRQYAALDTGTRTDATGAPSVADKPSDDSSSSDQYAAITVERYDRTGDERIDRTSDILFQALVRDEDLVGRALVLLGKVGPALYGTLVHLAFAADVEWQDIPGIGSDGVEQSFSLGGIVRYGFDGSIRTDVVLRDDDGTIIAVWDVKTGNAELTDARRQEIREALDLSDNVQIIELHICRGVRCKRREDLDSD
jgi:hypothetical protein